MVPTARIATCGWLMIGMPKSVPNEPGLVTVNVPPCTSSGLSCLARARAATSAMPGDAEQTLLVGLVHDRHDQTPVQGYRETEVDVLLVDDRSPSMAALRTGIARSASATALEMKAR